MTSAPVLVGSEVLTKSRSFCSVCARTWICPANSPSPDPFNAAADPASPALATPAISLGCAGSLTSTVR